MTAFKRTAIVAALWIVGCTIAGIGVDVWDGDHTGIVFVLIAVCIGVSGAVAHGALLFSPRYRTAWLPVQLALCWTGTLLGLLLILAATRHLSEVWAPDVRKYLPGLVLEPSLLATVLFTSGVYAYLGRTRT